MKILVTGGSGFIGSTLVKLLLEKNYKVLNIDKLSKQSVNESLDKYKKNKNYFFKKIDINNYKKLEKIFFEFKPHSIFHLAAESHVDRSIKNPEIFIKTNILGTYNLLEISKNFYQKNKFSKRFIFIHVSTDEIYGSLSKRNYNKFNENTNINPSSPYSASKACSDLLVNAWNKTFNLPIIITNCSNNFGPWQFPEKLIPIVIYNAIRKKSIPIFGNGKNIRDWIDVRDHANGLYLVFKKGKIGERYNIGTNQEFSNIQICKKIFKILNNKVDKNFNYLKLINFVNDRKGHDYRYAIDNTKIKKELNFKSKYQFDQSIEKTIGWYLENISWVKSKLKK